MGRTSALRSARDLRDILQDKYGVRTSIDLRTGRTGGWDNHQTWGVLGHHVVSRRSQGDTPFYRLVRFGRSDLPGPLAQGYLGFDEVFRLITMDQANHSGRGGPWTLPRGRVPENAGRPVLFGVEVEGGIEWSDWPRSFREYQARMFAGILDWAGLDERSYGEHGNPWALGRKVDRIWYYRNLARARSEIAAALGREYEGDVMTCQHGDRGDAVEVLQIELKELGFEPGAVDGIFGNQTRRALRAFYRSKGKDWSGKNYRGWGYRLFQRELTRQRAEVDRHGNQHRRIKETNQRVKALEDIHAEGGVHPVVVSGTPASE